MTRIAGLATCLFLFLSPLHSAEPGKLDDLLQQLGSKTPKTREKARLALDKLGADSLPALRKAITHPDLEVRRRIVEAVSRIETAELLKPTLVSVQGDRMSGRQMLEELGRQAGCKIDMWNDDPKILHRINLEGVPFWKAVDEIGRLTNLGPMLGYGDDRLRFQKEKGQPAHICHNSAFRFVATSFEYHRSLGFHRVGEGGRLPERSETLTLHYILFAEPRLPILSISEANVQEAIDNNGRPLQDPLVPAKSDEPAAPALRRPARYGNGYATTSMQGSVMLGRPSEKARGLKSLRVGLPVNLLMEQKSEVVCDKVLEVKNKKFKVGTTTFEIDSCVKSGDRNQYLLKTTVTEENLPSDDYTWMNSLHRRVELLDEKGNKYEHHGSGWSSSAGNHVQATFHFGQGNGELGPPRKLMFQVWKTLPYQVQVELRDMPLP